MRTRLLSVRDLSVHFGRLVAVNRIAFDLSAGDVLGLLGPNGAGKTTALRAIAGLQEATTGSVLILDQPATPQNIGQNVGFTPDTPALYESLTVEQFLKFIADAYALGSRLADERIDHWLAMLWLSEKRTARIGTLSRGMRQRVAVARTLLPDPNVILLDEPAAGLDPAGRVQFRRLLASLRDMGKALIVSSHILSDLAEYCTHVGIMGHGRLLRFGTVAEVSGSRDASKAEYHIGLVAPVYELSEKLKAVPGAEGLRVLRGDDQRIVVEFAAEPQAAARLLSSLIAAHLPVCEFRAAQADLEQAYLRAGVAQVD